MNISHVDIHVFRDSSITGACAVAYDKVFQQHRLKQKIIASKSCLSKQKLSISRLELLATHMAANLLDIGSRGAHGNKIPSLWWKGPTWLENRDQWPLLSIIKANGETEKEAKKIKTIYLLTSSY